MALEAMERETYIGFDKSSNVCEIGSLDPSIIRKLDQFCKDHPKDYKKVNEIIVDGVVEGKEYTCPKRLISFRAPVKRKMSDEQKQEVSERLQKGKKESKKK